MRTNIVIDDALMRKAMRASKLRTKRATVEAGLRQIIRLKEQARLAGLFGAFPDFANVREPAARRAAGRP